MIGGGSPWFHEEVRRRIDVEIADKSLGLGRGDASDYAAYQYGCGYLAGLRSAQDHLDDVRKEMNL